MNSHEAISKKIVLISTSAGNLKGNDTGVWLEEIAAPYLAFKEKGYEIVVASPAGGGIPIDKGSMGDGFMTDDCKKFMHDADAIGAICHSVKLDTISFPGDVDAIYLPGGHGCCVDFINNPVLKSAIETMYNAGKIVATVCHGPICLAECNKADGTPLVQGLTVTGFADSEEAAVGMTALVPYLIETRFKEQGAKYEKADDWNSKVCVAGNLITGQNPGSSVAAAATVIKALSV
jgi:putative intracellular protease/amidase